MSRIIGIPPQQLFPNIGFSVPVKSITGAKVDSNETRLRLAQHMSVLQSFGRTDLAALGQLRIGSGGKPVTVLQKSGVLLPTRRGPFKDATDLLFGVAMRSTNRGVFAAVSGVAVVTDSQQPPVSPNAKTVPLDLAYWYGTEIILEDDTTVVLASDIKSLVIIAQTLTIGKNVSISWDRPSAVSPSVPLKPGTPEDYPQADGVWSERGRDGFFGLPGGQGAHGQPAPELELWFLQSTGFPAIDLRGQDGFQGGKGGDGGDGGRGQKGCNTKKNYGFCSQEQGAGGDGGNGGRAGDGGPGGNGGDGGKFTVFAPQLVINAWLQGGLTISVDGGNVGSGGDPGRPGEGGPGGDKGDKLHTVCQNNNRQPGVKGNTGPSASRGPDGKKGVLLIDPIRFSSISQSDFNIELTKPAIVSIWPRAAYVSDTVSVNGLRFVPGDMIFIEGMDGQINVPCETTFVSDTLLTFKVPNVPGGYALIEAVQSDGTRSSSRGTLVIRPRIETVIPTGRVRPGEYYFIRGTGLGRSGNIWINNEGIGPFESVDNTTVKFKARRPSNAESNSSGERVKLKVVNAEGAGLGSPNHSPEIDIVLDTYRILAFGDSVMWGGGLQEYQKYYSLAADYIAAKSDNIGVYKTIKAHHGAKIGAGDNTVKDEIPGEMSSRYPTINQQIDSLSSISDAAEIDLVLLDGGANDIPITDVMLLTAPKELQQKRQQLIQKTRQYCFDDMVNLLRKVVAQYPKAKVIVTGYYHIFSAESRLNSLSALYLAISDGEIFPIDTPEETSFKLTVLCETWVSESNKNLSAAVKSVNDNLSGEPRIFFVNPETTPRNAAHAPESFLWEPDTFGGPQDPMWEAIRKQQREEHKARLESEHATWGNGYKITKRNSSYHPNPAGAQRYFEKMRPVLDLTSKARRVALRSNSGHYLCAEGGGNGALVANQITIGSWETFELIDLGNSQVALRSVNSFYVCADGGGGANVTVNRMRIGAWETFTLVPQGPGFAFKASNGRYLSATSGGGSTVVASASQVTVAEIFRIL